MSRDAGGQEVMIMLNDQKEQWLAQIQEYLVPILDEQKVELVALKIAGGGRRYVIEIFVDLPTGGISMAQCAQINRAITNKIDENDLIAEDFVVEVCSPGLDWPLVTEKDFGRVMHRAIKVSLNEPVQEKTEYAGTVASVSDGQVVLQGESGDVVIPLPQIKKAVQFLP